MKRLIVDLISTFAIVLVVAAVVSFLYSLIVHGAGSIDWETSFRLAVILGIVLPLTQKRGSKGKEE